MRKRIIGTNTPGPAEAGADWLPLEQVAAVEVTSEETSHPIEGALLGDAEAGWRAALPGEQTVRLVFDDSQQLSRVRLLFVEREVEGENAAARSALKSSFPKVARPASVTVGIAFR